MKKRIKQPIKLKYRILKLIFIFLYFSATLVLPLYFLLTFYSSKHSFLYAGTIAFISLIFLDIVCTFLEEQCPKIYNRLINIADRRKKEKEKRLQDLENLLLDNKNYEKEIAYAEESLRLFKEKIQDEKDTISKKIMEQVFRICTKMENLIQDLKNDPQEYYQIRHAFQVYFPEFQKMTYLFFDISKINDLDKESEADYENMLTEYEKYIDYVRGNINKMDKLNLKVGITSLVKIIESERKKGEENAEN